MVTRIGYRFYLDELIAKVRALVEEHPETRYWKGAGAYGSSTVCSYKRGKSRDGAVMNGCLFGQLLPQDWVEEDHMVVIDKALRNLSNEGDSTNHGFEILDDEENRQDKLEWLARVQRRQDSGFTWKESIEEADDAFPSVAETNPR